MIELTCKFWVCKYDSVCTDLSKHKIRVSLIGQIPFRVPNILVPSVRLQGIH